MQDFNPEKIVRPCTTPGQLVVTCCQSAVMRTGPRLGLVPRKLWDRSAMSATVAEMESRVSRAALALLRFTCVF